MTYRGVGRRPFDGEGHLRAAVLPLPQTIIRNRLFFQDSRLSAAVVGVLMIWQQLDVPDKEDEHVFYIHLIQNTLKGNRIPLWRNMERRLSGGEVD